MLTPQAPRHSAAASPCPSAKPPEAMKGILRDCRARERRMKLVMSDSPTWLGKVLVDGDFEQRVDGDDGKDAVCGWMGVQR